MLAARCFHSVVETSNYRAGAFSTCLSRKPFGHRYGFEHGFGFVHSFLIFGFRRGIVHPAAPPACTYALLSLSSAVRMVMHVSRLPLKEK